MLYAIVSDIHANLPAWRTVLTDIRSAGAEQILCLGDTVGYGPSPAAVLEHVYAHVDHFILGNHDAAVCGKLDPSCFNSDALAVLDWTRARLDRKAYAFLESLPYVLVGKGFRCSHGSPASPPRFRYVLEPDDAQAAWQACSEQLLFVGHTHVPGLHVVGASGTPHWLEPQDFAVEEGKRYIVNVGSVGQPRDRDIRASYCLFHADTGSVNFRRVAFDVDAYRAEVDAARLPVSRPSYFLRLAESAARPPLRELLDFHPPNAAALAGAPECAEAHLAGAADAARRWRLGALILLLVLGLLLCGGWLAWRARTPQPVHYAALGSVGARVLPAVDADCLRAPEPQGRVTADNRLREWAVTLADARLQSVTVEAAAADTGAARETVFRLRSEALLDIALVSTVFPASSGMRFQVCGKFKSAAPVSGALELCLCQRGPKGRLHTVVRHPIEGVTPGKWHRRAKTSAPLERDGPVCWVLRGKLEGELLVGGFTMTRRQ